MHRYVGASGVVVLLILGDFSTPVSSDTSATFRGPIAAVPFGIHEASGLLKNGPSSGFETNLGQADARYDFLARRPQMMVYLDGGDVTLRPGEGEDVITMKLRGRNRRARARSIDRLPATVNYYRGPRGRAWHSDIPTYARVEYSGVYRGVDLAYYFDSRGQLEHDFIVAPGANPASIRLRIDGARSIHLDAAGDLQLQTTRGGVTLRKPALYQIAGTDRQPVDGRYVRRGARDIGFEVGAYDRTRPLWIDPVVYATYLGGSTNDEGRDIAVDSEGNAYVTGFTMSANLPVLNPSQPTVNGWQDAFVAKFDPAGTLQYCTYLGGSSMDTGEAIAVGSGGVVHVTGRTHRSIGVPADFPTTPGAFQTEGRYWDAFVARFDATGALVASTLFGGTDGDEGAGIAVDAHGNSYITGRTWSTDLPLVRPLQTGLRGYDAFAAKLNAGLTALEYSTFLGGSGSEYGRAAAVDAAGNLTVVGDTTSNDFPTASAFQASLKGSADAFVAKLDASGSAFVFSTYFGGVAPGFLGGEEGGRAVAVDAAGNIVFGGYTNSTDLPVAGEPSAISGPTNPVNGSYEDDAFVAKLSGSGSLLFCRYLGGNHYDDLRGIAVDGEGFVYVTGRTRSTNFPKADPGLYDVGAFRSADGGGSWTAVSGGLVSPSITAMVVDPATPTTLYAGTERDGIFKSTDGGVNWLASSQGLTKPFITALVIDPVTTSTLYAGTDGAKVFKTTDGGASWYPVTTGFYVPFVISLAIAPSDPQTLYAGTNIRGFPPLYRTVNGGATWSSVLAGDFNAIAIDPSSASIVYASTSGVLFRTVNGGSTWTAIFSEPTHLASITSIVIDRLSPTTLYVGTSGTGVYKSTDGGAAWLAASSGLTGAAKDVTTLSVDPINPNTVYAGTYGAGVFKSVDGAATWSASNAGIVNKRVTQFAINPHSPATMHAGLDNLQGDAYVAVLTGDGTLHGSVRVGGDGSDSGAGVAALSLGSVYLTGTTYARDYPTTPGAAQPQFGGALDAFVTRLACVSPLTLTSIGVDRGLLWPPDHSLVPVLLDYQVRGACGVVTCSLGVASNEPVNGAGDGDAEPDWEMIDARHVTLRAERGGLGAGRTYTLTVTCSDEAGRQATGNAVVTVPISYR